MKYKHIIWDWNGTLLDDRWLCVEAINHALKKRNLDIITEEKYQTVFCFPVENYYKSVGFDFTKEPFHVAGDEFVAYYGENFYKVDLHQDALHVLEKLEQSGITQSVLSAGKNDFLLDWIQNHNLSRFFIKVMGIDNQYATGKKALGMKWINELDYDPSEVVMIGDTIHDSDVAEAMNIDCVLVDNGHVNRQRLVTTKRKVVSGLMEFLSYIDKP